MRWTGEGEIDGGVSERRFEVERDGQVIPGILWAPHPDEGPAPLVLMGHGGSGHKRNERMLLLGQLFAGECGFAAAAIDGPVHGDRGPVTEAGQPEYIEMWQREGAVDGMIEDWRATLDALADLESIDAGRVGYWGLSMGTMFGLPYVAAEPRLRAAVLGKCGLTGPSVDRSHIDGRLREDAPRIELPVLFLMQWDDERFDRDGQIDLFDRIASEDKRLHAHPGPHAAMADEAIDASAEFLERYLED